MNADPFATTRWTLIAAAGSGGTAKAEALERLCAGYWRPIYHFVRRSGSGCEDAEDLTQGFFATLLERDDFAGLQRERGRFRAFLLASLKHYLANERDKAQRLKRGGGFAHLSLDWEVAEARFEVADPSATSPEDAFDREWALALLTQVLDRLRDEQAAAGKTQAFEQLRPFLSIGRDELDGAPLASKLAMNDGAMRVALHRLRKRYRELLREEVSRTLEDPGMVDQEMRVLLGAFTR